MAESIDEIFGETASPPPPRVLLAGRPGAGKGTQGANLAQRLGVRYLSTGELLRDEIRRRTALGRRVQRLVDSGELVPDHEMRKIVESGCGGAGYVLDGYPRTVSQAHGLFDRDETRPDLTIEIAVSRGVVEERLAARGRDDDDVAAVAARLAAYDDEMVPALALPARLSTLHRVDGEQSPDDVASAIWGAACATLRIPTAELTS